MNNRLVVKNLSASYKNKSILNKVSLELFGGELICLCGPNGSGKSTLMSIITGLASKKLVINCEKNPQIITKSEEKIEILGQKPAVLAKKIAFMQQSEYSVWNFSVKDYVLCGRYAYSNSGNYQPVDYKKVDEILKELELGEFANRNVHSLSGGEFQKVRLARALVQEPDFLILDEPANNLDFVYEPKLLDLLKSLCAGKGIGVLLTIHDVNLAARYADKIVLLPPGQTEISGLVSEVFTSENLAKTFGVELQTYQHPIYNCIQVYEK